MTLINGNLDCLLLMNNIPLEVVDKYLGFYIHKSGKMSAAIDHNALSGIRAMRSLVDLTTNKKLMVPTDEKLQPVENTCVNNFVNFS